MAIDLDALVRVFSFPRASLSVRIYRKRGLRTRVNHVMFGITIFMYLLSTAYWAYSLASGANQMYSYIGLAINPSKTLPDHTLVTQWAPLFNALTLINYVLSDGVVVWRAWVICLRNHRKYLWITIALLGITALTVLLTIATRIAGLIESPIVSLPNGNMLRRIIDIAQVTTLITSLLSNLTATGVVSVTAWRHWRIIRSTFTDKKSTRSNQILLLVVESGVVFCFSAIAVLLSALIRLPQGTLGDLYTPCQVQIAGAYPSIVLLLVNTQGSLNESSYTETAQHTGSIVFAPHSQNTTSLNFARNPAISGTEMRDNPFREIPLSGKGRLSDERSA
ncbi:hypothetical protein B0H17DRAFT_917027 [Mycena rosella]|uniref:Uncharacterized protein n=1 Tax=Mycena rosella TaxID=1033263 RepID=A0AAD7GYW9_MYCRO|nr:hypothetical protein B0H17DRAFT_917027 [Mycena rosella]